MSAPSPPPPAPVPLRLLVDRRFIPDCCANQSKRYAEYFRAEARLWGNALGRDATTDDLSVEPISQFLHELRHAGYSEKSIRRCRTRLLRLWRYSHRLGLASRCEPVKVDAGPAHLQLPSADRQATPPQVFSANGEPPPLLDRLLAQPAPPGTARHFFNETYVVERLLDKGDDAMIEHRAVHRSLLTHHERDIQLSEQSNAFAAEHFRWMKEQGKSNFAINKIRSCWFAQWRYACAKGLIEQPPTIKKFKVQRLPPDAWTIAEMKRMVAAASPWWRAILLVGYYTLQRRRALFTLPPANVDLDGATIEFPPSGNKTGMGIRCRIGPDCVAALRAIWPDVGEFVFELPPGNEISRQFRELLRAANVRPSLRRNGLFHKLRRTGATHACARGGRSIVADLLGHSTTYIGQVYIDKNLLPDHDAARLLPLLMDDSPSTERHEP